MTYVNNKYSAVQLRELTTMDDYLETVFVRVIAKQKNIIYGCAYRPPGADSDSFLSKMSDKLNYLRTNYPGVRVQIMGDFNLNLFTSSSCRVVREYVSLMHSFDFFPVVLRPTRISNTSITLIDHIWVNKTSEITDTGIILTNISDHFDLVLLSKKHHGWSRKQRREI